MEGCKPFQQRKRVFQQIRQQNPNEMVTITMEEQTQKNTRSIKKKDTLTDEQLEMQKKANGLFELLV